MSSRVVKDRCNSRDLKDRVVRAGSLSVCKTRSVGVQFYGHNKVSPSEHVNSSIYYWYCPARSFIGSLQGKTWNVFVSVPDASLSNYELLGNGHRCNFYWIIHGTSNITSTSSGAPRFGTRRFKGVDALMFQVCVSQAEIVTKKKGPMSKIWGNESGVQHLDTLYNFI